MHGSVYDAEGAKADRATKRIAEGMDITVLGGVLLAEVMRYEYLWEGPPSISVNVPRRNWSRCAAIIAWVAVLISTSGPAHAASLCSVTDRGGFSLVNDMVAIECGAGGGFSHKPVRRGVMRPAVGFAKCEV